MSEEKEQYGTVRLPKPKRIPEVAREIAQKVNVGHGGARVAGPGKKIGRPTGKTRVPMTFKIPNLLADRLREEENQTGLIVRLLSEYYGISEP